MRYSLAGLAALSQIGNVVAFPGVVETLAERQQQKGGFPEPTPGFNAKQQHVEVTGKHKFVPPNFAKGDVRGPCPGLNALANHNYLPHSGVADHLEFITATEKVFGMSTDLSGFLTVFGAVVDGDGLKWSIGGPSKELPGVAPLLGTPQGISGSHNRYESDVSPGRGDLYKYGDDFYLQMDQFKELYDMGQAKGDEYTLETIIEFRSKRFDNSVATNPYFFNGPFTGVFVAPAAFSFIYRFMSNKSEEHPNGLLRGDVLMSFFGVHKDRNGILHKRDGHERIPHHWYKRAIGDEYSIPTLNLDTTVAINKHPKFASVGGNQGKVNTFAGISPEKLSGGALNSKTLLKGNNLACLSMEFAVQTAPDLIRCSKVLGNLEGLMSKLQKQFAKSTEKLSCPKLDVPNDSQFKQFPGYAKLNCKTGQYVP